MAHQKAVLLLGIFLLFTVSVLGQFKTAPVDPVLSKIEYPNFEEDEIYDFVNNQANPQITNFAILTFTKDPSIPDTGAAYTAWVTRTKELFNNVRLLKQVDAAYNEITEANTDLSYPVALNENFRIVLGDTVLNTKTSFWAALFFPIGDSQQYFPVRVSVPSSVFDNIGISQLVDRHFSVDLVSGILRSKGILFDMRDRQRSGATFQDDGTGVPIWRRHTASQLNTPIFSQDSASFVTPPITPDTYNFPSLKTIQNNQLTANNKYIITNGAPGPNGEGRYFKLAFQSNVLLEPGQNLGCFYLLPAVKEVNCAEWFNFWILDAAGNQVAATTQQYSATGRRQADIPANTLPAKFETNTRITRTLAQNIVLTTGTTYLPGDTIFVEFQLKSNLAIDGYFGLAANLLLVANGALDFRPVLRRINLGDNLPGNPILLRLRNADATVNNNVLRTLTHLRFDPNTRANTLVDRFMPHTNAIRVKTHSILVYAGRADQKAGFQKTISATEPLSKIFWSIGSPAQTVAAPAPLSLDDNSSKNVNPGIVLSSLTSSDFAITLQENGDTARAYTGSVVVSVSGNSLIPFESNSYLTLFFDPPIEVRNGVVTIKFLDSKTARDTAGVLTGTEGNKVIGIDATSDNLKARYTMNVDCFTSYGLLGCGAECRHPSDPNNCGACSVVCTGKNKCMFKSQLVDTAANRALPSSYECKDPLTEVPVPVPLNPAANPTRPDFPANILHCPESGSGAGWCFLWRDLSPMFASLGAVSPTNNVLVSYHTRFLFKPTATKPAKPSFEVRLYNDFDALSLANALPLIPNNPLLLGSLYTSRELFSTPIGGTTDAEWYSVGSRPSNVVLVALKFADLETAKAIKDLIPVEDMLRIQINSVRGSLLPSSPPGGFSLSTPPVWSNVDFTEPQVVKYDYLKPFDELNNSGISFRPSPGGVVVRWQASPDTQTDEYDVYLQIQLATDTNVPSTLFDVVNNVRARVGKRDWESLESIERCCDKEFFGIFRFQQNRVGRIDVAGLTPSTQYRAFLVFGDTNNMPNYSPVVTRVFATSVLIGSNDARSTININLAKTVTVSV